MLPFPRYIFTIFLFLLLSACGTLSVKSTPSEAEVYVRVNGKEELRRLGLTPYRSDVNALPELANQGPITIVIKKDGYFDQNYFVPNLFSADLSIDATLSENVPKDYVEVNRIVSLAFQGERLVLQKRYDEALKIADDIRKLNPNIVIAFHLIGTVNYLKSNLKDSRFAWIRALQLDPNDPEAKNMLETIDKKSTTASERGK